MAFWLVFVCMLQHRGITSTDVETHYATLGSDVSLSCEVSSLPESSTLQWEREGTPTANTTLFYNNTIFLLLYNVSEDSQGKYFCNAKDHQYQIYLNVSQYTYNKSHILYRANNSKVSLTCKSKNCYNTATWKNKSSQKPLAPILTAGISMIHKNRFSTHAYDGFSFPLHVKPVMFEDSGDYGCYVRNDAVVFTTIQLETLRVSADPPGGVFRDQPVVLTCEVSEVTEQVTLAWLSMERGRGVLVKQEVLTKGGNKSLSVTVNSVREEQVLWKCAVFTENKLRALVPITLHLLSTQTPPSGQSNHTSVPPKQGPPEEGSSLITMVAMVSAAVLGICILVAALVFCCNISTTAGEILLSARRESHFTQSDPPSINTTGAQIHRGKEDVIYSTVSASGSQQDPSSQSKKEPTSSVQEIIYSTINIS